MCLEAGDRVANLNWLWRFIFSSPGAPLLDWHVLRDHFLTIVPAGQLRKHLILADWSGKDRFSCVTDAVPGKTGSTSECN